MLKLYELTEGIRNLMALMENEAEGWDVALAELEGNFQDKAINLAKLIKTWEAEEQVYKDEITRLTGHMKAAQNRRAWAMGYLKRNMEEAGIDHIKGDVVDIRLQASPPSVVVPFWGDIPTEFVSGNITLSWEELELIGDLIDRADMKVDKRAILEQFKATGETIPGVTIMQGTHIRIR